jgi:hypothetical protein
MAASSKTLLIELDNILTSFLKAYANKRLKRFEALKELDHLKEITYGNNKDYWRLDDRFKALEGWFIQVGPRLSRDCFDQDMIQQMVTCVEKIGSYGRIEITTDQHKASWVEKSKAAKVAALANAYLQERSRPLGYEYTPMGLKLVKPPENPSSAHEKANANDWDIKDKFKASLNYQREMIEYFHKPDDHLFGVAKYLLDQLEKEPDVNTNHMAASILYFMKLNGYKVEPYVERLRQQTKRQSKNGNA